MVYQVTSFSRTGPEVESLRKNGLREEERFVSGHDLGRAKWTSVRVRNTENKSLPLCRRLVRSSCFRNGAPLNIQTDPPRPDTAERARIAVKFIFVSHRPLCTWRHGCCCIGSSRKDRRTHQQFLRRRFQLMAIPATQMRPGMIIKHNNDLHLVFSVEHRTPGNLRAFIQAKLRNIRTGAMFEHRFRSGDAIEKINVDEVAMEFLYQDGDDFYFMNTETYEQTHLTRDV